MELPPASAERAFSWDNHFLFRNYKINTYLILRHGTFLPPKKVTEVTYRTQETAPRKVSVFFRP